MQTCRPIDLATVSDKQLASFEAKIDFSGKCWVWMGGLSRGYGKIRVGSVETASRRIVAAHRLAWQLANQNHPLGQSDLVMHKCDNPPCVRFDHLFIGTHAKNMLDMAKKNRANNGSVTHPERLGRKPLTVGAVKSIRKSGSPVPILASKYGVSTVTIYHVRTRTTWKHVQ